MSPSTDWASAGDDIAMDLCWMAQLQILAGAAVR
jgi:hypothetical protein